MIIIQICIKKLTPFEQQTFLREYRMSLCSCFPSTCLFYRLFNCFVKEQILLQCCKVRDLTVNATHVSTEGRTWMNKWIIIDFFINKKLDLYIKFYSSMKFLFFSIIWSYWWRDYYEQCWSMFHYFLFWSISILSIFFSMKWAICNETDSSNFTLRSSREQAQPMPLLLHLNQSTADILIQEANSIYVSNTSFDDFVNDNDTHQLFLRYRER